MVAALVWSLVRPDGLAAAAFEVGFGGLVAWWLLGGQPHQVTATVVCALGLAGYHLATSHRAGLPRRARVTGASLRRLGLRAGLWALWTVLAWIGEVLVAAGLGIRLPAEVAVAGVVIIVITGVAVVAILSSADESRPDRGVDVR